MYVEHGVRAQRDGSYERFECAAVLVWLLISAATQCMAHASAEGQCGWRWFR
jgi:hypothetical protein